MSDSKSLNNGHRKRLRERFLNSGFEGFLDYEIVEFILTFGTPRKDCKPIAKDLINKFKNISNIINADKDELLQINGVGEINSIFFKVVSEVNRRTSGELLIGSSFDDSDIIFEFLKEKIGQEKKENFVILYFDTKNKLILNEVSVGVLNASLVHPREVFKHAILNNASHVVVAHNHPSGDTNPSSEDFETTRRLVEAGKILGISVVDHLIVSSNGYFSFKKQKLL